MGDPKSLSNNHRQPDALRERSGKLAIELLRPPVKDSLMKNIALQILVLVTLAQTSLAGAKP